jgi:hypothetical protein
MKSINYWETLMVCVSLRVLFAVPNTEFVQAFLQNLCGLWRAVLPLAGCCKHLLSYCVSSSEGIPLLDMFLLI